MDNNHSGVFLNTNLQFLFQPEAQCRTIPLERIKKYFFWFHSFNKKC